MTKKLLTPLPALLVCAAICGCVHVQPRAATDPLPSWNEGAAKRAILSFVQEVTDKTGPRHVKPADRIATFDNDGTLWAEKPSYVQVLFVFERIRDLAAQNPEWMKQQPFQGILEQGFLSLRNLGDYLKLLGASHASMTQDGFEQEAKRFLAAAKHPKFKVRYTELVYQPMLEVIAWLQKNEFKVFIVSGGDTDFVRMFSEEAYGIPRENVIGTSVQAEFRLLENRPVLTHRTEIVNPVNDREGKPVNIQRHTGRPPILAFGNSDGDIPMLQFAESEQRPWLSLLLHHDDDEREYGYDQGTEKALSLAAERNWTVVSMKDDFKLVFPFEKR